MAREYPTSFLLMYLLHTKHHFCCQDICILFSCTHHSPILVPSHIYRSSTRHQTPFLLPRQRFEYPYYTPTTIFVGKTFFIYYFFTLNLEKILLSNMVRRRYKLVIKKLPTLNIHKQCVLWPHQNHEFCYFLNFRKFSKKKIQKKLIYIFIHRNH